LPDLEKISTIAYVLELLEGLDILPTFNVADLYEVHEGMVDEDEYITDWKEKIPKHDRVEIEKILEKRHIGRIRSQKMKKYLVPCKGKGLEETTWTLE